MTRRDFFKRTVGALALASVGRAPLSPLYKVRFRFSQPYLDPMILFHLSKAQREFMNRVGPSVVRPG